MKHGLVIFTSLFSINIALAQDIDNFTHDMEYALHVHDTASTYEAEIEALNIFKDVCKKYEDQWLAFYWTSYLYTQVGRLADMQKRDENPMSFIDDAQEYFDKAFRLLSNKSEEDKSSFHALQSLIYSFKDRLSEESNGKKFDILALEEINNAIRANADNPVVYVLSGTELISVGNNESNYSKILAGKILLQEAQKIFEKSLPKRHLTTHLNQEWLPFWLPYAEKLLSGENKSSN